MKHFVYVGIGLAVFLILVNIDISEFQSITGASIVKDNTESDQTYAYNVHDTVKQFFGIQSIMFPQNTCGDVARDMYIDLTYKDVDTITGFDSNGNQKIASINFVTDRLRRYGTVDLVKGAELLKNYDSDIMISFNVESIVTVPKEQRANFFSMDLMGMQEGSVIYVTKGRYSTPSFDCIFVKQNGDTICNCDAHPIQGIEVAGITAYIPSTNLYDEIKAELIKNQ